MAYSVCTIRIRPIRAEGLRGDHGAVQNPLIVGQVLPWKNTRKSKPLENGGPDPSWKGTKTMVDLPYFGHPLPGVKPYIALMVMDKPSIGPSYMDDDDIDDGEESDDLREEMARSDAPKFVGRADFDLLGYLSRRHDIHTLRLRLQDRKGREAGELICTLQFVLTGVVRLTVLSGIGLKSNVQRNPDQEPYVEAYLAPGKGKKKKTNHREGENPSWGNYTRQPSLVGFASLGFFKGNDQQLTKKRRRQPNILEFKYRDLDRTQVPRLMIAVKDKLDTPLKEERQEEREAAQIQRIESRIRELRIERETENEALHAEQKKGGGWFFGGKKKEAQILEAPLTEEEQELVEKLTEKIEKRRNEAKVSDEKKQDPIIGTGSLDIRSVLNYDGIREAQTITVNLVDENNLATGTVTCMLEFDNAAHDRSKDVLKMPSFEDFTWGAALEMDSKQLANEIYKVYLYSEIQLGLMAPDFVVRTSNQTGFPKVVIFSGFIMMGLLALATLWLGLGTRTISYSVGVLYPVYQSYKALEDRSNEKNQQWLTYWIVYGCLNALEGTVLRPFTFIYPNFFYILKIMILMWLVNPSQLGATLIYHIVVAPWMRRHEGSIDRALSTFQKTAKEAAKDFAGIYDHIEEEIQLLQINSPGASIGYSNRKVIDDDPFGFIKPKKKDKRSSKQRPKKTNGTRVFVALEDQKDNFKMILMKDDMSMDDVCLVSATTLGISDDCELYMDVAGSMVTIESRDDIRENDRLFLRQL